MSTQIEITRIQNARNKLRNKAVELGIGSTVDKIDVLAAEFDGIENVGAVNVNVQEGDTYNIPAGYHNGNGTVSGISGGGNYTLQAKTVTPTKKQQAVASDAGYYGLSGVTVEAIPEAYQDVSSVTATDEDVLATKIIVDASGTTVPGAMPNNGAVSKTLDANANNQTYDVPKGYHNGSGSVKIVLETKSVTPTKATQNITPASGKVLSKVTINPIPADYVDTTDADASASQILAGSSAYVNGVKIPGEMANNGSTSGSFDGLAKLSFSIPAGYTTGGTVTLTSDIEDALAAI